MFIPDRQDILADVDGALDYIRSHQEVTNVLLTGGDPLMLPTAKLEAIVRQLRAIDHISIIRIGTKMPAFNPYRIIDDPALPEMLARYSTPEKRIYIMAHTDTGDDGVTRIKTIGKLLNEKITLEGLLTMVLRTHVEGGQFQFSTRNNGRDTVKTPLGMFDSDYIDNDLAAVDSAVCEFYEIPTSINQHAA